MNRLSSVSKKSGALQALLRERCGGTPGGLQLHQAGVAVYRRDHYSDIEAFSRESEALKIRTRVIKPEVCDLHRASAGACCP